MPKNWNSEEIKKLLYNELDFLEGELKEIKKSPMYIKTSSGNVRANSTADYYGGLLERVRSVVRTLTELGGEEEGNTLERWLKENEISK